MRLGSLLNQGNIFDRIHKSLGMVEEVRFSLSYIGKGGGFSVIESLKRVDADAQGPRSRLRGIMVLGIPACCRKEEYGPLFVWRWRSGI